MPTCEICDDELDDNDDAICHACEHGPIQVEVDDPAREQKMRFFQQYGD